MAVSDETKQHLAVVKKGKPRKFVLLTKGATVVSLVLYKRGAPEKFIKEAKENGTGVPCYGVVNGQGMDLRFQLAVSDGFEKQPVKDLILKNYLEEVADFKCKPLIEIVQSVPFIFDEDDPLAQRFLALQGAALAACEAHADKAEAINALCLKIGRMLEGDTPEKAEPDVDALEMLLKSLGANTAPPTGDAPQPGPQNAERDKLRTNLQSLTTKIKQAITSAPQRKDEILGLVNDVKEVLDDPDATDFTFAKQQLKSLVVLLAAAPGGLSLVRLGKARLEWPDLSRHAADELHRLQKELTGMFGNDKSQADAFQAALQTLNDLSNKVQVNLAAELDGVLNASETDRPAKLQAAKSTVAGLVTLLDDDPVMNELDGNEALPDMLVVAPLRKNLAEIASALG